MSYDQQQIDFPMALAPVALDDVGTTEYPVGSQPLVVRAIWVNITTQFTTTPNVVTFRFRPTPGSDTGSTVIGTITLPIASVAGTQLYKNVTPFECTPGGVIAAVSGGEAADGAGIPGFRATPSWEHPSNNASQVASA